MSLTAAEEVLKYPYRRGNMERWGASLDTYRLVASRGDAVRILTELGYACSDDLHTVSLSTDMVGENTESVLGEASSWSS